MTLLETLAPVEPMFFEDAIPTKLADLTVEIRREAAELGRGLHPHSAAELADLVRMMNCYYSNLIEGHNTRPKDIERALAGAEIEPERRALALEAKAHVEVQREIDAMHRSGELPSPTSIGFIQWLHGRFYAEMPKEFRYVERPDETRMQIVPGEFRSRDRTQLADLRGEAAIRGILATRGDECRDHDARRRRHRNQGDRAPLRPQPETGPPGDAR